MTRPHLVVVILLSVMLAGIALPAAASQLRSFDGNTGWLNSEALTPESLRGKIVLIDFWDYTCINCLKDLPYEKAWYERYHQYGFTIIGVHRPEFDFAGETANVAAAVKRLGIAWPVVLDSSSQIWQRYGVAYWPTTFLVDGEGRIVRTHTGEGDYVETEREIQRLVQQQLAQDHKPPAQLPTPMLLLPADSYDKPGAVCYPQTQEVYVGPTHGEAVAVGNGQGYHRGAVVTYSDSGRNHFDGLVYLSGPWYNADQAMVHARNDDTAADHLDLRYHAIEVISVLKPENGKPMTVYIEQDGKPLRATDAGTDVRVDASGRSYVLVDAPRAYILVMNKHFGHHDLRLRVPAYGLGVYSFAFESCEVGADR